MKPVSYYTPAIRRAISNAVREALTKRSSRWQYRDKRTTDHPSNIGGVSMKWYAAKVNNLSLVNHNLAEHHVRAINYEGPQGTPCVVVERD